MFNFDAPFMHFYGAGNLGFPPYLKTTTPTCTYSINNTNLSENLVKHISGADYAVRCKRVVGVFIDSENLDYVSHWLGEPAVAYFMNPYSTSTTRLMICPIPTDGAEALENTEATVIFKQDVGTTTDMFFCDMIWEPMRLLAETIPLCIPTEFEEALEDYVMGTVQKLVNGKESDLLQKFNNYWITKFRNSITDGAKTNDNRLKPRWC